MSTSVDQRMKGQSNQVNNGPKEEEFLGDTWRSQTHQSYGNQPMSSSSIAADPYMSNYYQSMTFPYLNQGGLGGTGGAGPGEGATAWSNGDPITFLGGYNTGQMTAGEHHPQAAPAHPYMDGMFGQSSFGGTAQYNQFSFFPPGGNGGDYSTWGTPPMSTTSRKTGINHGYHEDYYHRDPVGGSMYDPHIPDVRGMSGSLKHMEQGMGQLSISSDHGTAIVSPDVEPKDIKSNMGNGNQSVMDHHLSGGNSGGGNELNSPGGQPLSQSNSSGVSSSGGSNAPKKMTWASVASQPAKPQPKMKNKSMLPAPMFPGRPNMDIGTWDMKNGCGPGMNIAPTGNMSLVATNAPPPVVQNRQTWAPIRNGNMGRSAHVTYIPQNNSNAQVIQHTTGGFPQHPVLDKLRSDNNYNPKEFDASPKNARFFIIKSYSEDDIHRSIKYSVWCSTEHGNKRLDAAFRERENKGPIYLLFSVNSSGHFCGMAQMMSAVDYSNSCSVWAQNKWKGQIQVKWIYVKDVPNPQLRHIKLENNENKPVTNSRDTQEVPYEKGKQVLRILIQYKHSTSIFDDFIHYEKRQEEDNAKKLQVS